MKSQERHKMHRNELADWLAKWIERLKPYSNLAFVAVLLVALGTGAAIWWVRQAGAQTSQAWEGFYRAMLSGDPAELEKVIAQHPGADVAHWAAVFAGDVYLSTGCQRLFSNRSSASDELRKAVEHYRTVQEESRVPALLEHASFGLAKAYEALAGTRQSQGELDKAIEAYKVLVEKFPHGAYAELAAHRVEELSRQDTKAFYDKFAQFDPQPAVSAAGGAPGQPPPFDLEGLSEEGAFPPLSESLGPEGSKTEQSPIKEGLSPPAEPAMPGAGGSETPPVQGPAAPEAAPVQGPAEPEKTPAEEPAKPEATPVPGPAEPEKTPAEEPAKPEAAPVPGPAEPEKTPAEEPAKPEAPKAQSPDQSPEPSGQDAAQPETASAPSSAPAEKPSQEAPAAAGEPSDEGATVPETPSETGR